MLEVNVEDGLSNYYTSIEIDYMKEVEHVTHPELHQLLEALLEYAKPHDSAVRQKYVDESILRERLSEGRSRRTLLCKDCREMIIFETKG